MFNTFTGERPDWRRHHHRRGPWGPFPFEFFAGQRGGGPRARRGDVRAAVLALLRERPMHGYEMIQELQARSRGVWRPSAGSIYPMLQLLEDEGLVAAEEIDGKRRFTLTAEGVAEAERRGEARPPWEQVGEAANEPAGRLRDGIAQLAVAVMQVVHAGNEDQIRRTLDILNDARRRIYTVLGEDIEPGDEVGEA